MARPFDADHTATGLLADVRAGWRERAACRGLDMDPPPGRERAALDVCYGCPVYLSCRTWVLSLTEHLDPGGVCGGLTYAARKHQRRSALVLAANAARAARPSPAAPRPSAGRDRRRSDGDL